MPDSFEPRYDHLSEEQKIYKLWERSGYFNPDTCIRDGVTKPDAEPFSIVLPPPNVTGLLHMGHAATIAIEDIMVRVARMQGYRTLWIPGTDHAAIATQSKVEKEIYKKEQRTRHDLGREEFLKRVEGFAEESRNAIIYQIRSMGASVDWSREAYTLDEKRSKAVRTAFKTMYDLGLIYRGTRIVNWDPKGQTTISDDEIVYEERAATLYTFRYGKNCEIPIATTRPETKVGDTGIAVHPDGKYKHLIGKEYDVEFCGVPLHLKVVGDTAVDPAFGTGAVGVTPAHSMTDWDIAKRHGLPHRQVINEYGKMMVHGPLGGKKTSEARAEIVAWLKSEGLLEKEEEISQNVAAAERTGGIIEPLPKLQWFVAVDSPFVMKKGLLWNTKATLKQLMRDAVASGKIKILPERFEKIYFHWIDNLRDWCISRQIWYGHRIPVWYHESKCVPRQGHEHETVKCRELVVANEKPVCEFCDAEFVQDPDTLDTWFSSGLWTFSALGWPEDTEDFRTYHPTSVLETGYDILFFWVARMILMSTCLLRNIPFHTVYLHGLVRDDKGRKMSKSIGNVIDPLEMSEKYGADATRLSLIIGAAPGNDIKLSEDRVRGYRNFSTKIWNIARFIKMNVADVTEAKKEEMGLSAKLANRAEVKELAALKTEVTAHIDAFEFHLAAEKLYHYTWHTLADKIVEAEKEKLFNGKMDEMIESYHLLEYLLLESMKMLHPFIPFVTEAVYQKFLPAEVSAKEGRAGKLLMVEKW